MNVLMACVRMVVSVPTVWAPTPVTVLAPGGKEQTATRVNLRFSKLH